MNWKTKARIQKLVALLPASLSYSVYYALQRSAGALRQFSPVNNLTAGAAICGKIVGQGKTPVGKTFFEVGTGPRINVPLALWLCGAAKVVTVDLNRYLRRELVRKDLAYIAGNGGEIRDLFHGLPLDEERLRTLLGLAAKKCRLPDVLAACGIQYIAPGDAGAVPLAEGSIDYHVSYTVFEHIPPAALRRILAEGRRIARRGATFIHCIDLRDHFAKSDPSIGPVNFLRFSDAEWEKLAGNRYAYCNRLRVDDFERMFCEAGLSVASLEPTVEPHALEMLRSGALPIDARFREKPPTVLATVQSWMVATKEDGGRRL